MNIKISLNSSIAFIYETLYGIAKKIRKLFIHSKLSKNQMINMIENSKKQNPKVAIYSMPALYQIDDLVKCEG